MHDQMMISRYLLGVLLTIKSHIHTLTSGKSVRLLYINGEESKHYIDLRSCISPNVRVIMYVNNMHTMVNDVEQLIERLYMSWDKFSGCELYPVCKHKDFNQFNKWVGEYGKLRLELLDHMIETLSEEIAL